MELYLVLNLGSTSFKFKLFDFSDGEQVLASGGVERVGNSGGKYVFAAAGGKSAGDCECPSHAEAFDFCFSLLRQAGILKSLGDLAAVGYKAVHGGRLSGVQPVDDSLLAVMESLVTFAPVHNPVYIRMMRDIRTRYPRLPQVACFETAFHATIPEYRTLYGVPLDWVEKYGIRRYGFHGASHRFIAQRMQALEPSASRVISAHLGGSSSLCAIRDGQSVATSMGATLQSGVFQNNRVGDFDAFCLPELARQYQDQGGLDAVMRILSSQSGLLGLSGVSNDLREILQAREDGNPRADLTIRAYVDGIIGTIGMYTAWLGGLDALVFTGGIGRGSAVIRQLTCAGLEFLGIRLDPALNEACAEGRISAAGSPVSIWAIETNEELMVARLSRDYLRAQYKEASI